MEKTPPTTAPTAPPPSTDHFGEDPPDAANFLSRYREARAAASPPTSPPLKSAAAPVAVPPKSPTLRSDTARSVWGSVFHPLGRSPTSADRYDLSPGQTSKPGNSASEVHSKGTGISLDEKGDD